jgi:hypothetical protein
MNRSVDVTAPDYFLSAVPVPLAERGYYVFPVNLVKRLLEDDGLADPGMVHAADPAKLASMFDADAVLYITIERWQAQYMLIDTSVTVAASYVLKDGHTGETLWSGSAAEVYKSSSQAGNDAASLIVAIIAAAVTKAAPNYMPLARQANMHVLAFPGPGFPSGPYHPEHGKDWAPAGATGIATPGGPPTVPPPAPDPALATTVAPAAR